MTKSVTPFNSPLETGIRSLCILEAAYPSSSDIHRLVELDYLVVHSGDAGGPHSLHAALPMRAGELLIRREVIERGLLLMISRGLIERIVDTSGIRYEAGETAGPFLEAMTAPYLMELRQRAHWAVEAFGDIAIDSMRAITQGFFEKWTTEFQPLQRSSAGL